MTTEALKRQNLGPVTLICIMCVLLLSLSLIVVDNPLEGVSGGHGNHTDTQSTILPGNTCPNGCPWPDCGCNGPVLTLEPTVYITVFPTFDPQTTPVIPGFGSTVFPTLVVDEIPTGLPTPYPTADIWPTEVVGPITTIEPPVRDIDWPDGSGGGFDRNNP